MLLFPSSAPAVLLARTGLLFTTLMYLSRGLLTYIRSEANEQLTPVIITGNGALQGKLGYSRGGREYWQFLGIPYAEPPVNSLRFQPPVPVKPWGSQEVKRVTKWPRACLQFDPLLVARILGVEDCLFLNVFTTESAVAAGNSVVLVYFHGGAFLLGESAIYHPTFLMDHGPIVVVSCQYRLGPLGFLNFQEAENPSYPRGNMGLKDQNLVLRWVQKNIGMFGGDASKVTIMGDSAGAASVNFHMLSPLSRGLFHRAIAVAGSSLCPWAFTERPREIAEKYAMRLGCSFQKNSSDELLDCFQNTNPNDLIKLQWSWADPTLEKDLFVPSLEILSTNDTFLAERPIEIIQSGKMSPVPLMSGVTSGEGSLRSARFDAMPELFQKLENDWDGMIGRVMFFDEDPISPEISRYVRNFYFEESQRNSSGISDRQKKNVLKIITELSGDALFYEPVHYTAMQHGKMGAPTYLFYYDYRSKLLSGLYSFYRAVKLSDGGLSPFRLLQGVLGDWVREKLLGGEQRQRSVYGVSHSENTLQVWDTFGFLGSLVEADREFSDAFLRTLVNFANGREPTFRGLQWPSISSNMSSVPHMLMDESGHGKIIPEPINNRMRFWERLDMLRAERR